MFIKFWWTIEISLKEAIKIYKNVQEIAFKTSDPFFLEASDN